MLWALDQAEKVPAQCVAVLVGLARHADRYGRGAGPSADTLAGYARKTRRQVVSDLQKLVEVGTIRISDDQSAVAHIRADRRPKVYDLAVHDVKPASHRKPEEPTSPSEADFTPSEPRGEAHDMSSTSHRGPRGEAHCTPSTPRHEAGCTPSGEKAVHGVKPTSHEEVLSSVLRSSSSVETSPSPRGSRLAADWLPTSKLIEEMRIECPDVDTKAEHRQFVDYWIGVAGAKGRKADWPATWRNWMRRCQKDAMNYRRRGSAPAGPIGHIDRSGPKNVPAPLDDPIARAIAAKQREAS